MRDYIFIDQNVEKLKSDIHYNKKEVYSRLVEQCKLYFNENLPEEHPKSSTTFMGMAMANLSLAYLLTDQKEYLEEAKRWIFACVNYPHWGNAHLVDVDLSAAWILFGIGIAYDWLKDDLSEEERSAVRDKIILQGTRMYEFKINTEGSGWSTNYWQNHNWINLTGLAAAGYALQNEYDLAKEWTEVSKKNFDYVYSVLAPDGSDYEGVVYWRYGAMWLFVYAHLLKEREKIDYFKTCDFLKNTFYYRLYQAAPNLEEQINFGDCHDRRSGHSTAIYYKVASEYNDGYAQKLGNLVRDEFLYREAYESKVKPGILPECFFEVLFYNPKVEVKDFDDLPLIKFFPDLGLMVKRSSWNKGSVHFSFKCGHPGGKTQWKKLWELKREKNYNCFGLSHQHPDNNSFIINANNTYFSIDDGYNRSVKASDHNTVIVDGIGYCDEGQNNIWKNYKEDMTADIVKFETNDNYTYIAGEAAKVYDKSLNLENYTRHVLNTGKSYFVLLDELKSSDKHTYTWIMYSDFFPENNKDKFTYKSGYGEMDLYHFSDVETDYEFVQNNVRAVMTTQEPDKYTENKMKGLYVSNRHKTEQQSFLTVLAPKNSDNDIVVEKVKIDDAYGVKIKSNEETEVFIYSEKGQFSYMDKLINSKLALIKISKNNDIEVFKL
ncbi:DUF4962 domain-containing protein [Clostridium sp. DL1XJH146]